MLVDEVTQIGLIESCLLKMSKIRGAWDSMKLVSAGRLHDRRLVRTLVRVDNCLSSNESELVSFCVVDRVSLG